MVRELRWPSPLQKQLEQIYLYIFQDSYQNAGKVKDEILLSTRKLILNPEIHPPDKYKKDNDGSFRAYELYHYRIAYHITETQIIIVRIRHTSMNPRPY
jgi:plasmid stabilization system protein ParE